MVVVVGEWNEIVYDMGAGVCCPTRLEMRVVPWVGKGMVDDSG